MSKKVLYCFNCDSEFNVSIKDNSPVKYCPFCGRELEDDDGYDDLESNYWDGD